MTIMEVFDQAKTLSPQERKELAKLLIDSLEVSPAPEAAEPEEHWGQSLVQLIQSLDLSDWEAVEMDDPVAWVKSLQ